jgi:hypothetical protein
MKTIYNGKRYDSDKCEVLAERDHYTINSNNYSGTTYIMRASDGQLLIHTDANGQDCWTTDAFWVPDEHIDFTGYKMTDAQCKRCAELGLIVDVD